MFNVLTPLRRAFAELAIDEEYLATDPLAGFTLERVEADLSEDGEDEIDPYTTPDEIATALPLAEPQYANLFEFWAWVGPRSGELIALTWPDVDLQTDTLRISKSRRESA